MSGISIDWWTSFHNLLQQHDLVALNTWQHDLGPTFRFQAKHSRIDFVICRRHFSDTTSKRVNYLQDFPLNSLDGARHFPILVSLLKAWHYTPSSKPTGWTLKQRLALYKMWRNPTDQTILLQQQINEAIQTLPTDGACLDRVHQTLNNFGLKAHQEQTQPWYDKDLKPFQLFQAHTARLHTLVEPTLRNCFQAWYHVGRRGHARQQMRAASKRARKERIQRLFDLAGQAERAHDHFTLYQVIRELAPKKPFRKIQICDQQGILLNPVEAADSLQNWFGALYTDAGTQIHAATFHWPFTWEELAEGFHALPLLKALTPESAPAPYWQCAAEPLATQLTEYLQRCGDQGDFPDRWSQGTLFFIPKSAKRRLLPKELRPITLLEPCNKVCMGILAQRLQHEAGSHLNSLPQFAYTKMRGGDDALHRIILHCSHVRNLCDSQKYIIHSLARGGSHHAVCGGALLSLDLSKAFDNVNRSRLMACLHKLQISADLISFLQTVYSSTTYKFEYRGETRCFDATRGIRQGCKAAPGLWLIFTALILEEVSSRTSNTWMKDCLTMFADDICMHQAVETPEQLHRLIRHIGVVLDILQEFLMDVNINKTSAILRLKGPAAAKLQKQYVVRNKKGTFLKIPRTNGTVTHIQLVSHIQYLGVTVSYRGFERQTARARIKASEKVSQQLHRWLHAQRSLNSHQKCRLWQQCVYACMRYGLITVGLTPFSVQQIFSASLRQLRRIHREPPHLYKTTHEEFLEQHQLAHPLLILRDLCLQADARDQARRAHLQADDILFRVPTMDYQQRCQVIDDFLLQNRNRRHDLEVLTPEAQHICPHCLLPFSNITRLRTHLTVEHDDRSGALRLFTMKDIHNGVPTCNRCKTRFVNFESLNYHVTYVCSATTQDLEDVEHRLRVQELLQFARSQQIQALEARPDLLTYFHNTCALCSMFCTTTRGLYVHWQRHHHAEFLQHESVNNDLLQHCSDQSPCKLCGTSFKQYHKCHIVRQMALLLINEGYGNPTVQSQLACPDCGKVYTTHHGLQQHMRRYHRATQDCSTMDELSVDLMCLLHQAVEQNRAEELLQHEDIQFFLTTRCVPCGKSFPRKQELTRHFHLNHSSEWHECFQRALLMDNRWKPQYGCICQPRQHTKHVCTFYIQFILLRLEHERQLQPQIAPLPPDLVLSPTEQIEPLLWLGCAHLLYDKPDLRLALTRICQICGHNSRDGDDLHRHLHADHPQHMEDIQSFKEMFQWSLFQEQGCFCNPSPGWGHPHHECVGIIQLAWVAHSFNWQVVLPWSYGSHDLATGVSEMLPLQALQRVTLAMMARNFHKLWQDGDLELMLKTRCLLCQENVPLWQIRAHLSVVHQVTLEQVKYVMPQVAKIFADLNSEVVQCEWCSTTLPTWSTDEEDVPDHLTHMKECPYVMQMALLLMMPKWHCPALQPMAWSTQEHISAVRRQHALQKWQLHAGISDTFGLSLETVAQFGLQMMTDPIIAETVGYRCLLCGRCFYIAQSFERHLHREHNFLQMQTLMCYHRLTLHGGSKCQFCGFNHSTAPCIPLLNLAVFLLNGYGIRGAGRHRLSIEDLWELAQPGAAATAWTRPTRAQERGQEKTENPTGTHRQGLSKYFQHSSAKRSAEAVDSSDPASRRPSQLPDARIPVLDPYEPRPRVHSAHLTPSEPTVACGQREGHEPQAPPSLHHDTNVGASPSEADLRDTDGGAVHRLCEVPSHMSRPRQDNAVPTMEPTETKPSADFGSGIADQRSPEMSGQHTEDHGRPSGDIALSRAHQTEGGEGDHTGHSVVMDGLPPSVTGVVARAESLVLPQYLAAHPDPTSAPAPGEATFGQAVAEGVVRLIPVFLNLTGTTCFANTAVLCLAWMTLMVDGFHPQMWTTGFELLRNVYEAAHRPMNLLHHNPFLWLLMGSWTVDRLHHQQDVCEFTIYLLSLMRPKFIHCGWVTKVALTADPSDGLLESEKGQQHTPILLPYIDHQDATCQLQDLVFQWHDPQGFCRAATEVGSHLVLMLDRFNPETQLKCTQMIYFHDQLLFPCFQDSTGTIHLEHFDICGVIFHLGNSPQAGHYRAALRYQNAWMIYDDNRAPDKKVELPAEVFQNCTMFWLTRPNAHSDRTMGRTPPREEQWYGRAWDNSRSAGSRRSEANGPYNREGSHEPGATWLHLCCWQHRAFWHCCGACAVLRWSRGGTALGSTWAAAVALGAAALRMRGCAEPFGRCAALC